VSVIQPWANELALPETVTTRVTWRAVAALLLNMAILLVAPWFTALFFAPAYTIAAGIVGLLCLVAFSYRRIELNVQSPDTWVILFAFYTALTNLWAASVSSSIEITAGEIAALALFILSKRYAHLIVQWMPIAVALIGIALYIFGMGAGVHLWTALSAVYGNHLLASVFEYHNTFGAFELGAGVAAYVTLAQQVVRDGATQPRKGNIFAARWKPALGSLALMIAMAAVLASQSRAVWVVALVAVAAMLVIVFRGDRQHAGWMLLRSLATLVIGGIAGFLSIKALDHGNAAYFFLALVVSLVGCVLLAVADVYLGTRRMKKKQTIITVVVALLAVGTAVFVLRHQFLHSSTAIAARIQSISFASVSLQERFYYYGNALHMWLNSPIVGSGGGTWNAKFQAFQTLPYWSRQVHSTFFDQLLNGGVIGLVLYFGLLVVVALQIVRYVRKSSSPTRRNLVMGFALGAAVLWVHSLFDFDFAFGYYQYTFWAWLAVAVGLSELPETSIKGVETAATAEAGPLSVSVSSVRAAASSIFAARPRIFAERAGLVILAAVTGFCVLFGFTLGASQIAMNDAQTNSVAQNPQAAIADVRAASVLAPYAVHAQLALSQYYISTASSTQDTALYATAWRYAQAAQGGAPWDPTVQSEASLIAYQLHHYRVAAAWAETAYHDAHFSQIDLRNLLGITMWYGAEQLRANPSLGLHELHKVLQFYTAYHKSESVVNKSLFPDSIILKEDASMQVYLGTTYYLLHRYNQSLHALNPLLKAHRDQAAVNLYMIGTALDDQALGRNVKQRNAYLKQIQKNPGALAEYNYLKSL